MADHEHDMQARGYRQAYDRADIDSGLRRYMLSVYNYMALGVAFTAIVTLFTISNPTLFAAIAGGGFWIVFIALLGLGFFAPRIIANGSSGTAQMTYWVYAGLWGLLIAPMIAAFIGQGLEMEILRAFLITSVLFGGLSLYGYTTNRSLSAWGGFLFMAILGLLFAMILNFFFGSNFIGFVLSIGVVLVFSAVTAYQTQMVKSMYIASDGAAMVQRKAIFGALLLYGSFITLFIHILNILGFLNSE